MKTLLILLTSGISYFLPADEAKPGGPKVTAKSTFSQGSQPITGNIPAIEFKNQRYCRAEADDFEFDVKFKIVSATAYFMGANFRDMQVRKINSNDLLPLSDLMSKCIPGTTVVFDNIRVLGPDNEVRQIKGMTYRLY